MSRRRLTGLRPQTYEHPLDAQALNALQKTSGLETVIRKCNEWGFERLLRVQLTGSHMRVTAPFVCLLGAFASVVVGTLGGCATQREQRLSSAEARERPTDEKCEPKGKPARRPSPTAAAC